MPYGCRCTSTTRDIAQAHQRNRDADRPMAPLSTEGTSGRRGSRYTASRSRGGRGELESDLPIVPVVPVTLAVMCITSTTYWHMVVARCVIDSARRHASSVSSTSGSPHASRVLLPGEQLILQACGRGA